MKNIISRSAAVVALAAGLAACGNDGLTSINTNPNQPTRVDPQQLFTSAVTNGMYTMRGTSFEHGLEALWVQHYAEVQYPEADLYRPRAATIEGLWNTMYPGPIEDLTKAIQQGADKPGIWAPALVMRSAYYQEITDLWGDIPYTQATQGDGGSSAILSPAYDAQAVVYDSLFAALTKASDALAGATNAYGSTDPIYGGSPAQWQKLANSLRLRMAMRLSNVDAQRGKTEFVAAMAGPLLASNADNAAVVWPGGVNQNPLFQNWKDGGGGTRDDQRLSVRFVDTLKATNDPRLAAYAQPTDSSTRCTVAGCYPKYVGAPNGVSANSIPLAMASRPSMNIRSEGSPSYVMRYPEVLFLQAEAVKRGWITGDAAALYNAAITASMKLWGVDDASIAAYLAQPGIAYNDATGLQQIAYQKWVALFNEEIEAYSEWRRLGVPTLTPGPKAAFNSVPRRLTYPDLEYSLNGANVAAAVTNQGGAALTDRVWWDK